MLEIRLPSDLIEKYLDLKCDRDFCLKNGAFIAAFHYQVKIIEFYNALSRKHQKREEIADHYQIAKVLVQDCFGSTEESLFDCIYSDVAVALGYNTPLSAIPSYDIMVNAICTHINIIKFFYMVESPKEEIEQYINNILSAYSAKYGKQNDAYLKLCLHLLFEGIFPSDSEYALRLFNEHYDRFVSQLMGYEFTYGVFLVIASAYTEMENFDSANILLDMSEKKYRQLPDAEKQKNVKLQCAWRRARILSLQGQYVQSEAYCTESLKLITSSHPSFPEICVIMMTNCGFAGRSGSNWIEEGLLACKELNYTESLTYYRLLAGFAGEEYQKGNIADAISHARVVLDGVESISGKENNVYITALFSYFAYLDNEKAKRDFLDDIIDTIYELNNPFVKAFAYNILAGLGYNMVGEETLDDAELEQVARNAVEASDSASNEYMKIAARINLLRQIVVQVKRYSCLESEIKQLFSFLESHRSKMQVPQIYQLKVCYIIYYCNHGQAQRALEIAESIKQNIAQIESMPELLRDFDRVFIEVLLANNKNIEAITELKAQVNKIANNAQKANDLAFVSGHLIFALSVIAQYGKEADYYSELSYKCALMLKYINVKFQPDFNRSETNLDISRQISALELRKTNIDSLKDDSGIQNELKALRYKLNYSSDKTFRMPSFKDIRLDETSVLFDVCMFFERKHGDFTGSQGGEEKSLDAKLAVFAVYDENGCRQIKRLNNIDVDAIIEIFESDGAEYAISELRYLYDMFFGQFEQNFAGKETLYLSLDNILSVIPFGALLDRGNETIVDKYNLINVLVATDISPDFNVALDDALLMGNPRYGIDKKYADEIEDLPYTEVEVNQIECLAASSKKYLHEKANKDTFYSNLDSNIIHISSHGRMEAFDPDKLQTPLIESSVLLSGFVDFINGEKADGYGNGLLTAEDIISLDLSKTSLVVLSACESGAGYVSDSTSIPKGMRWALGFTGAKASLTSIYEVSDIGTALFMVLFYRNLKKLPVARAMNEAKRQMRNLTVRDIKSDSVLYSAFGHEVAVWEDFEKPFDQLEYWCAFECYFYGGVL